MEHALSFLADTYETERLKTLGVWAAFADAELIFKPEPRARTPHEHMVHQCAGEDFWMRTMLGIDLGKPPLPVPETRLGFLEAYALASAARLAELRSRSAPWFEEKAPFFDTERSRAWILTRRIAHSAHHRGQLTIYLRLLGKALHSTYGPTADTGGLFQNGAAVVYPHDSVAELLSAAREGRAPRTLPGVGSRSPTERP